MKEIKGEGEKQGEEVMKKLTLEETVSRQILVL